MKNLTLSLCIAAFGVMSLTFAFSPAPLMASDSYNDNECEQKGQCNSDTKCLPASSYCSDNVDGNPNCRCDDGGYCACDL